MKVSKNFVAESVSYQTEVPKNFPVEYINFLKFTEKYFPDESGKSQTKEKKIFEDDVEKGWEVTMVETAYKALVEVYGSAPVPLFPAGPCPECSKIGVLGIAVVTSNSETHWCSVVVNDDFLTLNNLIQFSHLNFNYFRKNTRKQFLSSLGPLSPNYYREVRLEDFMSSGYFPTNLNNLRVKFSAKLLQMWHHLSLLTLETSLNQFSNALYRTSQDAGHSAIINSSMFQSASKAYAYVSHLIHKRVKVIKKKWCRACTSEITEELEPHSAHLDENLKLCRRRREKQ
ncbi:hypothetical protein GHT06_008894 [Daphnia sinensis]|uniref:CxC3 like cysteine cluster domain-containing protein n=1 Tax=Daphnia sinensis TaxID=1820382 RepID=A0AAD5Q357_9CRUS|nr:hypothetical protein GHT06_008894 [Daphnia sinensis]